MQSMKQPLNQKAESREKKHLLFSCFHFKRGLDIKCTHASQAVRQSAGGSYYRVRMKTQKIIIYTLRHIHSILSFRGNYLNELLCGQATVKNMQLVSLTGFHWRERGSHRHRPTPHCHL